MPTAETGAKLNQPTPSGAPAEKAGAPVFLSIVCQKDVLSAIESRGAKERGEYVISMSQASIVGKSSRRRFEGAEYHSVPSSTELLN